MSFLKSLDSSQALRLSWLLSGIIYCICIIIVVVPVRWYIKQEALGNIEPLPWALGYLFGQHPVDYFAEHHRCMIIVWCSIILAGGLLAVTRLTGLADVDTRRKIFHGMMVAMFLPSILLDPTFVALAFALVLALFLLLDLFRASQLVPISRPLTNFLLPYVDGRDHRGPVVVSHMFLLIGCATPLWLSLAGTSDQGWDVREKRLDMVAGIICVGMGDAAASLIGRRFGYRKWMWSGGKSVEGSMAFAVAVFIGLSFGRILLDFLHDKSHADLAVALKSEFFLKASVAGLGASLTEAVLTGGNDNVIVPLVLWLLVRQLDL